MLWYGYNINKDLKQSLKNTKCKQRTQERNLALTLNHRCNMNYQSRGFHVPSNWSTLLLTSITKRTPYIVVYAYSQTYFFQFPLPTQHVGLSFNSQTQVATFTRYYSNSFFLTFLGIFNLVLYSFFRVFFNKLTFKGKGYYIYKNIRNTITPQFGYSHRLYFYSYFISVKFLSKTKIFIFGLSTRDIYLKSYQIKASKPINIYTGRGVRFARQVIYKKDGKVSSYR
mgnify:CR=1 FL=1|jgi:ribosomal protein L6P/L9E